MGTPRPRRATLRFGAQERLQMQRAAVVVICLLLILVLRPYFLGVIQQRDFQTCQSHVRQISRGLTNYMQDWDETLPLAAEWNYSLQGNMAALSQTGFKVGDYFRCPRDRSGAPTSYAYNDVLSGLSLSARESGEKSRIARPDRAPLIIEKHGSAVNAHMPLPDWETVTRELTRPHALASGPTGSLVMGGGRVTSRNAEELGELAGRRF